MMPDQIVEPWNVFDIKDGWKMNVGGVSVDAVGVPPSPRLNTMAMVPDGAAPPAAAAAAATPPPAKKEEEAPAPAAAAAAAEEEEDGSDSDSDSGSDDDFGDDPGEFVPRPVSNVRRATISAKPVAVAEGWKPPVIPKSDADVQQIKDVISGIFLFSALGAASPDTDTIIQAMQSTSFPKDTEIIAEGADGDAFYIVTEGSCDVTKKGAGKVAEVQAAKEGVKNFFGELALLYGAPRAATVTSATDVKCWTLDSMTFKKILMDSTMRTRNLYSEFLEQVPILAMLTEYDRLTMADSLKPESFKEGDRILTEGDVGTTFYIVLEGEVKVTKEGGGDGQTEVSDRLKRGDYFGELALLSKAARQATVTATVATQVLSMDHGTFNRLVLATSLPTPDGIQRSASLMDVLDEKKVEYEKRNSAVAGAISAPSAVAVAAATTTTGEDEAK
jgi:cAMP-dependent protein kinase regulator